MNGRKKQEIWKDYLWSLAVAYGFAGVFSFFAPVPWPQRLVSAGISGFVFGTMFFILGAIGPRTKSRSFLLQCLIRSAAICATMCVGLLITIPVSISLFSKHYPWDPEIIGIFKTVAAPEHLLVWMSIGFAMSLMINGVYQVSRKLGPGVLWNWITGKYYKPREEELIFMFLDLKNSTTLAEKLGNIRFSELVQDFFKDLTDPLKETRGKVSHYIGDEAVLYWSPVSGLREANCVRCFYFMRQAIESRAAHYREKYGIIPEFKAGVHLGLVVATEVGDVKSEIVFHGDVLNTTARITGLCSELDSDLLISGELSRRLDLPGGLTQVSHGLRLLKGKEHEVEVFAIRSVDDAPGDLETKETPSPATAKR